MGQDTITEKLLNQITDDHFSSSLNTPLREDAFELTDIQKIKIIAEYFQHIMHTLGLDLTDDSLKDTPLRVAKMYVKEVFSGLNPANKRNTPYSIINISITKC